MSNGVILLKNTNLSSVFYFDISGPYVSHNVFMKQLFICWIKYWLHPRSIKQTLNHIIVNFQCLHQVCKYLTWPCWVHSSPCSASAYCSTRPWCRYTVDAHIREIDNSSLRIQSQIQINWPSDGVANLPTLGWNHFEWAGITFFL